MSNYLVAVALFDAISVIYVVARMYAESGLIPSKVARCNFHTNKLRRHNISYIYVRNVKFSVAVF